jgi:hypothetical protein
MQYTPWAVDPEKLEKAIEESIRFREQETRLAKEKADAYLNGYKQASYDVIQSLHCSNYEKEKGVE